MQSEEQRLIDGLFSRLQQAEQQSVPRDASAESVIAEHIRKQPAAPYYMSQTILIQEAALRRLNAKVQQLEQQLSAQAQRKPESGGFLAGLFGVGREEPRSGAPIPGTQQGYTPGGSFSAQSAAPQSAIPQPTSRASGFMAGALQTAAGVAGGVMLGNMLTGLFHHSQPEEIVNIIEPPASAQDNERQDAFLPDNEQDNNFEPTGYDDNDADDYDDDGGDFGGDDSSWF